MNIKKIIKYLTNPDYRFLLAAMKGKKDSVSDKEYITRIFHARMDAKLDLDNPVTFNEKMQWIKLYDRRPEQTVMVDKYLAREYISQRIGDEYLVPLVGVWENPDDIDFDSLPDKFVLKCNHNSGLGMCICHDKSTLDREKVVEGLKKGLAEDYYLMGREWPYKNVPRRVICEELLEDNVMGELVDYKFFCFDGEVYCTFVSTDRATKQGIKVSFFDREWKILPFKKRYPSIRENFPKPVNYDKMVEISALLSKTFPFLRVDFYEVEGRLYIGELTFCPGSGFEPFYPEEWDTILGNMVTLPPKKEYKD